MYLVLLSTLLILGTIPIKGCITNLNGDSGEFSINETYLNRPSNCSWTIGKGTSDIDFIVIKFEPFDLGNHCFAAQRKYVEVSDVNHQFKVKECGGGRPFEVLIKRQSAVVRFYSEITCRWGPYSSCSHDSQNIRLSFYVISKKPEGLNAKSWKPTIKQTKPGVVTIGWDPLTLPSKNYIVVPLYDSTAKEEPFIYIIELRNDTSMAVEYLKPATSYSFKVVAFDTTGTFIESTTSSIIMNNGSVRLMGGTLSNEGRAEVFKDGLWNKICFNDDRWNPISGNTLCRSLGLPDLLKFVYDREFMTTTLPIHLLEYSCNGTETSIEECKDTQSACKDYRRRRLSGVICGKQPVFHQTITDMAGVITSPGYPSSMTKADYRWTFMTNLTRGRVALYFDVLDLQRYEGNSKVYIQNSLTVYHGLTTVLTLPRKLHFYSSFSTRRIINRQYGKGMRVKYFLYNEPVPLLNNWTISLSISNNDGITANWTQVNVKGYDILGFLITCNSTQDWANEAVYAFGEKSSTSATCNGLIGYTNYDVYVLVMLKNQETGTCTTYKSSMASITTPKSSPSTIGPQRDYSTDITPNTAAISWKPLPGKYTLGYTVQLYSYSTSTYYKKIRTNVPSVVFRDLLPASRYRVKIKGYTAAGRGPYQDYYYFSTKCGGTIERQLHGKIQMSDANVWSETCIWKIIAPTQNTLILFHMKSLKIPFSFDCWDSSLTIKGDQGSSAQGRLCGSRHSLSFILLGFAEVKLYLTRPFWSTHMFSSFFMLENGLENVPSIKSWKILSFKKSSTSVNVSWDKYPGKESVSKYFVICTARKVSVSSTDGKKNSLVVQNLLKGTEYEVALLAILGNPSFFNFAKVDMTIFKSQDVIVKTAEDAPGKPPQHVQAWKSGSIVVVSWKPVDKEFTNGVIVGYYVYYRRQSGADLGYWERVHVKSYKTKIYLRNLWSDTKYRVEVSAATKVGEGPRSRRIFVTTGASNNMDDRIRYLGLW